MGNAGFVKMYLEPGQNTISLKAKAFLAPILLETKDAHKAEKTYFYEYSFGRSKEEAGPVIDSRYAAFFDENHYLVRHTTEDGQRIIGGLSESQ